MVAINIYDQSLVTLHSNRMFLIDQLPPATFVVKDNSTSLICTQAYMQGAPPTTLQKMINFPSQWKDMEWPDFQSFLWKAGQILPFLCTGNAI